MLSKLSYLINVMSHIHVISQVTNAVTKEMLKNPALLSALQGKLDSMAGTTSGYIEVSIPKSLIFASSCNDWLNMAILNVNNVNI